MEVERNVKAQPGGDSEASWSSGPRTTTQIPDFSVDELLSLATQSPVLGDPLADVELDEAVHSASLDEVSRDIDQLFGSLPASEQSSPAEKRSDEEAPSPRGFSRATSVVAGKLWFGRDAD